MIRFRQSPVAALLILAVAIASTGCTAHPPAAAPQLKHTPGAYIVVSPGHVDSGRFQLDYPRAWQLVKQSPANAERLHLMLIAPNGGRVSLRATDAIAAGNDRYIPLSPGEFLQVSVDPPDANLSDFSRQVEQLIGSIRISD